MFSPGGDDVYIGRRAHQPFKGELAPPGGKVDGTDTQHWRQALRTLRALAVSRRRHACARAAGPGEGEPAAWKHAALTDSILGAHSDGAAWQYFCAAPTTDLSIARLSPLRLPSACA